jgi:hypothetical protein
MALELPEWVHDPIWLDEHNAISYVTWRDQPEPYMAIWYHANPSTGAICYGSFAWRNPEPENRDLLLSTEALWQLVSAEPLTISPSLLCLDCGAHGFIEGGRWRAV